MELIDEKKANSFRQYFMEYSILFLVACVITLFGLYYNLNQFVMERVLQDKAAESIIIEKNTEALQLLINKTSRQ